MKLIRERKKKTKSQCIFAQKFKKRSYCGYQNQDKLNPIKPKMLLPLRIKIL
jgi:hypothetical protein